MTINIWKRKVSIGWPVIMVGIYLLITVTLFLAYVFYEMPKKMEPIVTGTVTGAFVALIQYLWSWAEASGAGKLKELKVTNVLLTRDEANYYGRMIGDSFSRIDLMGVTAKRFLEDFADSGSPREERKVLLRALERKVKIRILVASGSGLANDSESLKKAMHAKEALSHLSANYPNFEYGYYNHKPAHSIVLVDDSCIVGPSFEGRPSQHTPAIQMESSSPLVRVYLDHFEEEWRIKQPSI